MHGRLIFNWLENMTQYVAERKLLYSDKGSDLRKEFIVYLCAPYSVKEGTVNFPVVDGCSGCHIEVKGLNAEHPDVYGADSLQAITLACGRIEWLLKNLQKRYDIYFLTGEPYFESNGD